MWRSVRRITVAFLVTAIGASLLIEAVFPRGSLP